MEYKIIVDSCGELTDEMKMSGIYETASLSMQVGDAHIIDDETFDQADFLRKVAQSPECPKSSCPSPERYMAGYEGETKRVYVVTLSSELSGSYNSAELGKRLYMEGNEEKQIHVFNSRSASVGETLIAMKIRECEEQGMEFEEVVRTVENYIAGQHTYFVLENLETLRKNGRLTGIKAIVASALNIKPVMGATPEGTICQLGQARGIKRALAKMAEQIAKECADSKNKILGIAHCNCPSRAEEVKNMLLEKIEVRSSFIVDTAGISTMYANDGGVIVVL
ncbi:MULTISPECIES: DegV family protein [Lachnospiraceae]|jgi:DegV family protein with EDD domain|uniref:DegV family protein n=1 Tax=Faecalicatena acetigenes TaxID=2981790 RepID=A0ABT2TDC3_9FIRM|nr:MULTISPECIES: DegV family protein [Lachnospiraceae]MCU6747806.1 DegV family protein [Faecalicatena acetigenes]RGT71555.1 DegV family protein [Ruminococcus sp. AF18-22]SCI09843.1 Fatty acid-binding protein TM_1468 [uncultured Clostridium sp.]